MTHDDTRMKPARSAARFVVLAWLCAAATIAYICRNSIAVAESTIRKDLGLSEKEMGVVLSAFFLTYALGQIPSGWLANVWGSRRILPVLSASWSLATAAMGLATGFWFLVGARSLGGLTQAGIFPASANTVSKWFPPTGRAFACGSLASFMSLGGVLGAAITAALITHVSWRWILVLFSVPGMLWALGFYVWFRDRPEDHGRVSALELELIRSGESDEAKPETRPETTEQREPTPWLGILSSPAMWWICAQQFFRAAGYIFFASWFPTYLQEVHGVSPTESGFLTALPLLAVMAGSLVGGAVSDRILARTGSRAWSRKGVAALSQAACAVLVFFAYLVHDPVLAVLVISAGTFCSAFGGPAAYTITMDMGGRHVATVFSVMNMSGNLGAMLLTLIVPWFEEATGSGNSVLLLFGSMYIGAAASWLLLNPAGTIFMQSLAGKETRE